MSPPAHSRRGSGGRRTRAPDGAAVGKATMPDIDALAKEMAAAARGELETRWPAIKDFAENEFRKLGQTITFIGEKTAAGELSPEEARLLLEMQKNAARAVLLTLEGMALLTAEAAINAALGAVRSTVNAAVGFALL